MSVSVLAAIRPDDVNLALFVHVLGAMVLVGGVLTAATAGMLGWKGELGLRRLSYKTLLLVALPGYLVMRVAAEWTYFEENLDEAPESAWILIGYITADLGALLLLSALILGGIGLRRSRTGGGGALLKTTTVLSILLVVFYVIAVWAMGAKPN